MRHSLDSCAGPYFEANVGETAYGGALWCSNSIVSITGSRFVRNNATAGIPYEWAVPTSGGGGAIWSTNGFVNIESSLFLENSVYGGNGGALFLGNDAVISSSMFISNIATGTVATIGSGGAIMASADLTLDRCIFATNTIFGGAAQYFGMPFFVSLAQKGFGGAIAAGGPAWMTNCIFYANTATGGNGYGGPIRLSPFGDGGASSQAIW